MPSHIDKLLDQIRKSIRDDSFVRLTLSKPKDPTGDLIKVLIKYVELKKGASLSVVFRYQRKDLTKNFLLEEGIDQIESLLSEAFLNANLLTTHQDWVLEHLPNGKQKWIGKAPSITKKPVRSHDKVKPQRVQDQGFLVELGVLSPAGQIQKDKGDKFKQINKFVEIIESLIPKSGLQEQDNIQIHDMGAGKGYLTFALYDYLVNKLGQQVKAVGVEVRPDLVELCNSIARKLSFNGLSFEGGFISQYDIPSTDILIALHACDTATDDAIFKGIQAKASLIICSPCCHKQVRQCMLIPEKHKNLVGHGIMLERQAELLTDNMRALLMEAHGYKTKIFEFISSEHTGKNLMIVGERRKNPIDTQVKWDAYQAIKTEFGIERHYLEELLNQLS